MKKIFWALLFAFASTLYPLPSTLLLWAGPPPKNARRISPLSDSMRKVKKAPGPAAREVLRKFVLKTGDSSWRVRYSPKTALPEAVVGGKTRRYPGGPEAAALAFLNESRELLNVDVSSLKLAHSRTFMGVTHLQYAQTHNSIPVEFAYVRVHVNADGEVTGCQSRFEPDINVNVVPSVPADYAAAAALAEAGAGAGVAEKELVLFPDAEADGALKLAWKLKIRGAGGIWFYYVDASNAAVLFKYSDRRHVAAGTVSGTVYDVSPLPTGPQQEFPYWEKPVLRAISDQYVWIGSYNTKVATDQNGAYTGAGEGKIFASLKGPRFAVTNFRGAGAHYDNGGGAWSSVSTPRQSPHPYENSQNYTYSVTLTDNWTSFGYAFAKVMPRFAAPFQLGALNIGGTIDDADTLAVKTAAGATMGAYLGKRTAPFLGAAVEGPSYGISLKTDGNGVFNGFSVDISSYLLLTDNPTLTNNLTGSVVWSTSVAGVYMDRSLGPENGLSEVNAFYHLNKAYNYFGAINKDPNSANLPADLSKQVPVMVRAHGEADAIGSVGGMVNAYYDFDNDAIFLGDGQLESEYGALHSFALDGTIIRHEYTHLVVARIYPIINFGEFGAVSEAMADYFSLASFRPDGFDVDIVGNFMAFNESDRRDLSGAAPIGVRQMPTHWTGEEHDDSLILSQALWMLKNSTPTTSTDLGNFASGVFAGRPRSDVFTYVALFYFPDNFANFHDAMKEACRQLDPSRCDALMQARIDSAFAMHGISAIQPGGDAFEGNNGPEWATDISTISSLSATIYPTGDIDYYSAPLAAGDFSARLDLPVATEGADYKTYYTYSLLLFDNSRNYLADAVPAVYEGAGACPASGPCYTSQSGVTLSRSISASGAGRYYLAVIPGQSGASPVNSQVPYRLTLSHTPRGSARADLAAALYDNDEMSFSVPYLLAPMVVHPSSPTTDVKPGAEVVFDHAQLRDHNYQPLALARTDIAGNYLELKVGTLDDTTQDEYSRNVLRGTVKLKQGFANRYPGVGTVYLEIFGRNHLGRVVSLGVSNAINLSTNKSAVTAYNNVITGANSRSIIKYDVQSAGNLSIRVYTASGALVKTVYDGPVPAGKGTVDWDGTNDKGGKAASGIYFVKVTGAGLNSVEKIAVVR